MSILFLIVMGFIVWKRMEGLGRFKGGYLTMNYEYKKTARGDRHTVSGIENGWSITLTVYTSSGYHPTYFITASREGAYCVPVWCAPVAVSTLRKTFPVTLAYLKERAGIRKYKGV